MRTSRQVVWTALTPDAMLHRQVRIYQPTKSTMQSAKGKTKRWVLDWDTLQGAGRWENPLMGWASTADYMQGTQMIFRTREAAVAFVSAISTLTLVLSHHDRRTANLRPRSRAGTISFPSQRRPRSHQRTTVRWRSSSLRHTLTAANNYVFVPGKLRICHTK